MLLCPDSLHIQNFYWVYFSHLLSHVHFRVWCFVCDPHCKLVSVNSKAVELHFLTYSYLYCVLGKMFSGNYAVTAHCYHWFFPRGPYRGCANNRNPMFVSLFWVFNFFFSAWLHSKVNTCYSLCLIVVPPSSVGLLSPKNCFAPLWVLPHTAGYLIVYTDLL